MCDLLVVVRSAGERTVEPCRRLAIQQADVNSVIVICERPFAEAVRVTFAKGMESGKKWVLALDADILLRPGAIQRLLELGEAASDDTFLVQGRVLDLSFGGARDGGPHLFRTKWVRKAIDYLADADAQLRPEGHVVANMRAIGHPSSLNRDVVGIHDYNQYYKDLYRKAFVYAHKFSRCIEYLSSYWSRAGEDCPDYRILDAGLQDGRQFSGKVRIDVRDFPNRIDDMLSRIGLVERSPMGENEVDGEAVNGIIDGHSLPPEFSMMAPYIGGLSAVGVSPPGLIRRVCNRARADGVSGLWAALLRVLRTRNGKPGRDVSGTKLEIRDIHG